MRLQVLRMTACRADDANDCRFGLPYSKVVSLFDRGRPFLRREVPPLRSPSCRQGAGLENGKGRWPFVLAAYDVVTLPAEKLPRRSYQLCPTWRCI